MPYTAPTVNYSATHNGTYTTLTGIQSVNISRGRQRFQDPFPQTICTVELIPANSYTLPLAIGQFIDVRNANTSTSPCYFTGIITDVVRTYAMPYNSVNGAAPDDRITITATGGVGAIGSAVLDNYSISANAKVSDTLDSLIAAQNVAAVSGDYPILHSAQTLSASALDAVNELLRTGQFIIDDLDGQRLGTTLAVYFYPSGTDFFGVDYAYGDTGAGQRFKSIEYQSTVQNTFNYVKVEPAGLADQVTSGTAPFNSLVYTTYNASTADALSLSGYLYGLLSGQLTPVPFTIATDTTVSANCVDVSRLAYGITGGAIGQVATITFRGTTVSGQIQGIKTNFYADRANVQLYFSPTLGVPFTLDSNTFGVLDTNRLGYP